jgi:hypothetical protein
MDHERPSGDGFSLIQPRSSKMTMSPGAFVICPCMLPTGGRSPDGGVEDVYRLAYEQARAALLPPWHERHLLASFN